MKTNDPHLDPRAIDDDTRTYAKLLSVTTQAAKAAAVATHLLKPRDRRKRAEFDRQLRRHISRTPPEKEFLLLFLQQMLG